VCELLPGPVTLVIERPTFLPSHVNPDCDWIGVRIPNSLISQQLAENEPLCLTSANLSGESSAITANDFAALHPQLDALVDLGPITDSDMSRAGSTVVKLRFGAEKSYELIRDGCAKEKTLQILSRYAFKLYS